jgi:hypothetical protein
MMQTILSHALVLFASAAHAGHGPAPAELFCSVEPPVEESAARTRRIVRGSEVVVRAVAVGSSTPGRTLKPWDSDRLAFAVKEVLKGSDVPDTLLIHGIVTDQNDFQDGPVPYVTHRSRVSGGGACMTRFYKLGAEYLFLLSRRRGEPAAQLTPYWQLLAPTNEQLRGPDDPWLKWVRLQLRLTAPAAAPAQRRTTP